jgi:GT2 family glycosyltransferase
MPLAAKKNPKTEKLTPAEIDVEPLPGQEPEEQPSAPKVTALISSYNNAAALRRCIAALERSTSRDIMEIVVVDKGSQDESPRLDAEFPDATFLRLPRNFGNTKALNIGMRTGVGELVFFLSPEIEVAGDTIANLVNRLESDSDAVAVSPLIIDGQGAPREQVYRLPTPQTGVDLVPVAIDPNSGPAPVEYATFDALMARKYFIRGINYFDEHYGEFGGDAELCFQVRRAGRKTIMLPQVRVVRKEAPPERSSAAETLLAADRVNGIAVYLGKHYGFFSGILFRIKEILKALGSLRFSLLASLATASKVDGSQGVTL